MPSNSLFREVLSLGPGFTNEARLAGHRAPGIRLSWLAKASPVSASPALGLQVCAPMPGSPVGSGDGPQVLAQAWASSSRQDQLPSFLAFLLLLFCVRTLEERLLLGVKKQTQQPHWTLFLSSTQASLCLSVLICKMGWGVGDGSHPTQ